MRTEQEMFDLILNFGKNDPNILGIYMNGSRTNPHIMPDRYQDFDIVYVVEDVLKYLNDKTWINYFGEIAIMQEPDYNLFINMHDFEKNSINKYMFLMQFIDGNRIDLNIQTLDYMHKNIDHDKLCKILLDKLLIFPTIAEPTDNDYYTIKPTLMEFNSSLNEFWWVSPYVGKGLKREEITYAMDHLNFIVRDELIKIIAWNVACDHDFKINLGKNHKFLKNYIDSITYKKLLETYPTANINNMWQALFNACDLMQEIAPSLANKLHYSYNSEEAIKTIQYLKQLSTF